MAKISGYLTAHAIYTCNAVKRRTAMSEKEDGASQAVIERFVELQLPEVLNLEQKVADGEALDNGEIELLERLLHEIEDFNQFMVRYPQYDDLVAKISSLCETIASKALTIEREKKDQG